MTTARRGALIVFEGLDHCGKTSQAQRLAAVLSNAQVTGFPDRTTPLGQVIHQYLTGTAEHEDHVIHLLFSANRWERIESIRKMLESGTSVILDRYVYSGCVYSAAKGLDAAWCKAPDIGLIQPDLVIYLQIAPAIAALRGGYGLERYEKQRFQEKVRELFDQTLLPLPYCLSLDGTQEIEAISTQIKTRALETVAQAELQPLRWLV